MSSGSSSSSAANDVLVSSKNVAADDMSTKVNYEPDFSHVPWPIRPSPAINYDFVSTMYFIGSALALSFYLLEMKLLAPLLLTEGAAADDDDATTNNNESNTAGKEDKVEGGSNETWKEFANGMQGMYFIFLPFIPCLVWSLVVRYFWMKETKRCIPFDKKEN